MTIHLIRFLTIDEHPDNEDENEAMKNKRNMASLIYSSLSSHVRAHGDEMRSQTILKQKSIITFPDVRCTNFPIDMQWHKRYLVEHTRTFQPTYDCARTNVCFFASLSLTHTRTDIFSSMSIGLFNTQ